MNWKNARKIQPNDGQNVLISVNSVYYDAIYHKEGDTFIPTKMLGVKFKPKYFDVFWCEVTPPQVEKRKSSV